MPPGSAQIFNADAYRCGQKKVQFKLATPLIPMCLTPNSKHWSAHSSVHGRLARVSVGDFTVFLVSLRLPNPQLHPRPPESKQKGPGIRSLEANWLWLLALAVRCSGYWLSALAVISSLSARGGGVLPSGESEFLFSWWDSGKLKSELKQKSNEGMGKTLYLDGCAALDSAP